MTRSVLMYHDVIDDRSARVSGFTGASAEHYKLDALVFRRHLDQLRDLLAPAQSVSDTATLAGAESARRALLTFDDGGASAHGVIAPELEQRGLRGYFFIASDWIGQPGFLRAEHVQELARRGHVIGSHSASHPTNIAALDWPELVSEWKRSVAQLSELVGAPVRVGSIPGGYYSAAVARAAGAAGIEQLFTSEPTTREWSIDGVRLFGRFAVHRRTPLETVYGYACASPSAVVPEWALWQLKKFGKRWLARPYRTLREQLLAREQRSRSRRGQRETSDYAVHQRTSPG